MIQFVFYGAVDFLRPNQESFYELGAGFLVFKFSLTRQFST